MSCLLKHHRRRQGGFTLVELLIVVAIIGIVAAIAVPNLLSAIQAARQKRTMAEMRTMAELLQIYEQDHSFYPVVTGTMADVMPHLRGIVGSAAVRDGWDRPVYYWGDDGTTYTIASYGSDGERGDWVGGETFRFQDDIVITLAYFYQYPEGAQH